MANTIAESLIDAARRLQQRCAALAPDLDQPVSFSYDPLDYAKSVHEAYLSRFGGLGARTILLGMNPGPWGMGQTGVPFGDVHKVTGYLGLAGHEVTIPSGTHKKRPVMGLACSRGEVSGDRLWGAVEESFGTAEQAHAHIFVVNHCPLLLFDEMTRNLTPDKLRGDAARKLLEICDEHLREVVGILAAQRVIGVGKYAQRRAEMALKEVDVEIDLIPHPSPANPFSNRNGGADWRAAFAATIGR